jgi:hypothetical protein
LLRARASTCLTAADTAPCAPATAPDPGAFDVVSTEIAVDWLINREAAAADRDAPLPGIRLNVNPTEGITQMDSWFWVDPTTYAGQAYPFSVHIESPWVLMWKTKVHHHDEVRGSCPDNPAESCTTGFHDWDEIIQHSQNHLDVVDVTVTLTPTLYAWDFGDDTGGPLRPDSHASFSDKRGLGQAFVGILQPSTVIHRYTQSSLKVFDQGGYLVQLNATWAVSGHVIATRDGAVVENTTLSLPQRTGLFSARYQVRESQPVLVAGSR